MAHTIKVLETGQFIKRNYADIYDIYTLTGGTSLKTDTEVAYKDIVKVFGEPGLGRNGDAKVECEWVFETPQGVVTLYNYKSAKAYDNRYGKDVEDITDWHFGAKTIEAAEFILNILNIGLGR